MKTTKILRRFVSIIVHHLGTTPVSLYAKDGMVWMNQNQLSKLFDTSVPNISMHISNILKEGELELNSVEQVEVLTFIVLNLRKG